MPSSSVTNKQIFSDRHVSALQFGFFTSVWLTCCFTGHTSLDEYVPLNQRLLVSALSCVSVLQSSVDHTFG